MSPVPQDHFGTASKPISGTQFRMGCNEPSDLAAGRPADMGRAERVWPGRAQQPGQATVRPVSTTFVSPTSRKCLVFFIFDSFFEIFT